MMRALCITVSALTAAGGPLMASADRSPTLQHETLAVSALVDAAAKYVKSYQHELTSVVADEIYTQHVVAQMPRDGLRPLKTSLTSEIFFMFMTGHDWMAIRDVRAVNGAALEGRPDPRESLQQLPAPQVAAQFKAYNSRFNVGRVSRNFNEPTLSLLPLDDRHRGRFTFERARTRSTEDGPLVTLTLKERSGPTLVRNLDGGNAYATGELTVEPETGRVISAILAVTLGTVRATLSTTYELEEHLGIMVPVRFGEHYLDGVARAATKAHPRPRYEEIRCEAVYTNFRRFEVSARIR